MTRQRSPNFLQKRKVEKKSMIIHDKPTKKLRQKQEHKVNPPTTSNDVVTNENVKTGEYNEHENTQMRSLPLFIISQCIQRDYVDVMTDVEVWKLRHPENPDHVFPNLTKEQCHKVTKLYAKLRKASLAEHVILWDDDLGFVGEGGRDCGPYGEKGLSEFSYIMETIAYRLTPDRTEVVRPKEEEDTDTIKLHPMTSDDLINGTVGFLRVLK